MLPPPKASFGDKIIALASPPASKYKDAKMDDIDMYFDYTFIYTLSDYLIYTILYVPLYILSIKNDNKIYTSDQILPKYTLGLDVLQIRSFDWQLLK